MKSPVQGLPFSLIYVDELAPARKFYETYFGFEHQEDFRENEIFGKTGEVGMWIGAGYTRREANEKATRATVMFRVDSTAKLLQQLKDGRETVFHDEPVKMTEDEYWFQLADPAGNIIDVVGNL